MAPLLLLLQDQCPMAPTGRTELSKIALRPSPCPSGSKSLDDGWKEWELGEESQSQSRRHSELGFSP